MSDPTLPLLIADCAALLGLGLFGARLPTAGYSVLVTALCGLDFALCLPPLLLSSQPGHRTIPVGPPGLSLHFAFDALSLLFLIVVSLAAIVVSGFQSFAGRSAEIRMVAFCVGGTVLGLLAADGIALTLALTAACASGTKDRSGQRVVVPFLLLIAVCLLTPAGFAPRFDAIRAAPTDPGHAAAAAVLTSAACGFLTWRGTGERCGSRDALRVGVLIPFGCYLLLRIIVELSASALQAWCGFILLLAGGALAVIHAWRSAALPDMDAALDAIMLRHTGLAASGIGLAMVAHAADLPGAATFALEATCLTAVVAGLAGTATGLSAHLIGESAGTYRLSRLGGLVHTMPRTSAALAAGLLAASALPPSLGFAALWLSFQSILSAPRTDGLLAQLPLALIAAAIAFSAALATAASVRIVGIALLGRPRTPRGAGAAESAPRVAAALMAFAAIGLLSGTLLGPILRWLAKPAVYAVMGLPPRQGSGLLSIAGASSGYPAMPLLALLALAIGAAVMVIGWFAREPKSAGPWTDGMRSPAGLPFGDPAAQSIGQGFLPALPQLRLPRPPRLPAYRRIRLAPTTAGLWLITAAFGVLLLILAVNE